MPGSDQRGERIAGEDGRNRAGRSASDYGFEDLQFYREVAQPAERRSLREEIAEGALRDQAVDVLRKWADMLPSPVEPKF